MNLYVVLSTGGKLEIERFSSIEQWQIAKENINPERIIYSTNELSDEELNKYGFKEIIWGRIDNPIRNRKEKVFIPFSYVCSDMEKAFDEVKKERAKFYELETLRLEKKKMLKAAKAKAQQKSLRWRQAVRNNSGLISFDASEDEVLKQWRELNYIMPPPKAVTKLKRSSGMTWVEFIEVAKCV